MNKTKPAAPSVRNGNSTAPIKRWRLRLNLTQEEAAEHLGVHRITYSRLETYYKPIGRKLARKVSECTGQTPGTVMDEYSKRAS